MRAVCRGDCITNLGINMTEERQVESVSMLCHKETGWYYVEFRGETKCFEKDFAAASAYMHSLVKAAKGDPQ